MVFAKNVLHGTLKGNKEIYERKRKKERGRKKKKEKKERMNE